MPSYEAIKDKLSSGQTWEHSEIPKHPRSNRKLVYQNKNLSHSQLSNTYYQENYVNSFYSQNVPNYAVYLQPPNNTLKQNKQLVSNHSIGNAATVNADNYVRLKQQSNVNQQHGYHLSNTLPNLVAHENRLANYDSTGKHKILKRVNYANQTKSNYMPVTKFLVQNQSKPTVVINRSSRSLTLKPSVKRTTSVWVELSWVKFFNIFLWYFFFFLHFFFIMYFDYFGIKSILFKMFSLFVLFRLNQFTRINKNACDLNFIAHLVN